MLNLNCQGETITVFIVQLMIEAIIKTLELCPYFHSNRHYERFPNLKNYFSSTDGELSQEDT